MCITYRYYSIQKTNIYRAIIIQNEWPICLRKTIQPTVRQTYGHRYIVLKKCVECTNEVINYLQYAF